MSWFDGKVITQQDKKKKKKNNKRQAEMSKPFQKRTTFKSLNWI